MAVGKKTGGRQKGSLNKRTILKERKTKRRLLEAAASVQPLAIEDIEGLRASYREIASWFAPKPGEKPPEDINQLVLWKERMKEFERWSTHLFDASKATLPFQTPSLRSVILDDKREEKLPDAKRVLTTMDEVRQRMIQFGIQPADFARALLAKTIDIEALEEEEEQRAREAQSP
jgi:hypothetical protein